MHHLISFHIALLISPHHIAHPSSTRAHRIHHIHRPVAAAGILVPPRSAVSVSVSVSVSVAQCGPGAHSEPIDTDQPTILRRGIPSSSSSLTTTTTNATSPFFAHLLGTPKNHPVSNNNINIININININIDTSIPNAHTPHPHAPR